MGGRGVAVAGRRVGVAVGGRRVAVGGTGMDVGVGVGIGVWVGVSVAVGVAVSAGVGVSVGVGVNDGLGVLVGVGVTVGAGAIRESSGQVQLTLVTTVISTIPRTLRLSAFSLGVVFLSLPWWLKSVSTSITS